MIKHILAFSFRADAGEQAKEAVLAELADLPRQFPQMRRFEMGPNISWRDDRFQYAFVIEFDSEEDLDLYLRSEAHEELVAQRFRPLVAERAIVTFRY